MILEQWFVTPIWYGIYENICKTHYTSAIKYCKDVAASNPGRTRSNAGGWQSDNLFYKDTINTPLQIFFDEIKPRVKDAFVELGVKYDYAIENFWININYKGCSNYFHDHAGGALSGVFYLTNNNSEIVFKRTRDINTYHLDVIRSNRDTFLSSDKVSYTPQQGQYIIFPSWLMHQVETNNNDDERISIAFNVEVII